MLEDWCFIENNNITACKVLCPLHAPRWIFLTLLYMNKSHFTYDRNYHKYVCILWKFVTWHSKGVLWKWRDHNVSSFVPPCICIIILSSINLHAGLKFFLRFCNTVRFFTSRSRLFSLLFTPVVIANFCVCQVWNSSDRVQQRQGCQAPMQEEDTY